MAQPLCKSFGVPTITLVPTMKIKNKWNLPDTLVNLAERDPYSKGGADFSVTQLIDSPKISYLQEKHDHEIEVDITQSFWSLVGRAMHNVCEGGAEDHHIIEERMFMLIDGKTVSGAIDVQEVLDDKHVNIYDYKFTSAWAVQRVKEDWERQLNMYAQLVRSCKGMEVNKLFIVAIIRDWNRHKVGMKGYPPAPVQVIPIVKWPARHTIQYIRERVDAHTTARSLLSNGSAYGGCSDEERWKRNDVHAVYVNGSKRASKLFKDKEQAERLRDELCKKLPSSTVVRSETRPGAFVRCEGNWCMVREWCDQWAAMEKYEEEEDEGDGSGCY